MKIIRQQKVMVNLFNHLEFTLNSMLVIDVFISLKNPFYPRKVRMKEIYILLTAVNVILFTLFMTSGVLNETVSKVGILDKKIRF